MMQVRALTVGVAAFMAAVCAQATVLYSVDITTDRLVRIDTDTLYATYVGPIGAEVTDLTYNGQICALTFNGSYSDRFVTIDRTTGAVSYAVNLFDELGRQIPMAEGLAWDGSQMRMSFGYDFGWSDHYGVLDPTTGVLLSSETLPAMGSALGRADVDGLGYVPGRGMFGQNGEQAYTEIFDIDLRTRVGIDFNGAVADIWYQDGSLFAVGYQRLRTYSLDDGKLMTSSEILGLDANAALEGLAVVPSGDEVRVVPRAMTVKLGRLSRGTVQGLLRTDGDSVVVCKFVVPNQTAPPVNVEVEGGCPIGNPSTLHWSVYSRMENAGQFAQTLDLWDWTNSAWSQTDVRTDEVNTAWRTRTLNASQPVGKYVRGDGTLRARFRINRTGVVSTALWCLEVEEAYWTVTP